MGIPGEGAARSQRAGAVPRPLTASDIKDGAAKLRWLEDRVDDVNRIIDAFHQNEPKALSKRLLALKSGLQTSHNP